MIDTLFKIFIKLKKSLCKKAANNSTASSTLKELNNATCLTAFLEKMKQKTIELGMTDSYFSSPHGMVKTSYSTPRDLLKLGIAAYRYPQANKIWGQRSITLSIDGDNARTLTLHHTVIEEASKFISLNYDFLYGKGGSLIYDDYYRAQVLVFAVENQTVVIALMGRGRTSYKNIFKSAKEVIDMIKKKTNNKTVFEERNLRKLIRCGGGYAAYILPSNTDLYSLPKNLIENGCYISNSATASSYPASTSKIMTMLCALDYLTDPYEIITVDETDIIGGSGSAYFPGDEIRFIDAVTAMMLESSNTLANSVARFVGNKIIEQEHKKTQPKF